MNSFLNRFYTAVATGLGIGFLPVAPGTFGSIEALLLVWFLFPSGPMVQLILIGLTFLSGVYSSAKVAQERAHPDPPYVVIDEICGILITFFALPLTPSRLVLGFILFRCFDIFKLPWIRRLELLPNGFGIMLDDCAAGVLSHFVLRIFLAFHV